MKRVLVGLFLLVAMGPMVFADVPSLMTSQNIYVVNGQYRQNGTYLWIGGMESERSAYVIFDFSNLFPDNETNVTVNSVSLFSGTYRVGSAAPVDGVYAVADTTWTDDTIPYNPPPVKGDLLMTIQPAVGWSSFRQSSTALTNYIVGQMTSGNRKAALCIAQIDPWDAANYDAVFDNSLSLTINFTRVRAPKPVLTNGGEGISQGTVLTVSITCDNASAVVRYTTDGSDPTPASPVYTAPFQVTQTTVVKACSWIPGYSRSQIARMEYRFKPVGTETKVGASDDTYVWANYLDWNGGGSAAVIMLGNYYSTAPTKALMKFSIPALAKPAHGRTVINGAILYWAGGDEPYPFPNAAYDVPTATLYQVDNDSWTESAATWSNSPVLGPAIGSFDFPGIYNQTYSDVKAFVQAKVDGGSTTFSFGADAPNWYVDDAHRNMFRMYSKEIIYGPSYGPNLWVDYTLVYDPADSLTITPNGGSFTAPQSVTISGGTEGATVHYTLNGGDPTESDPVYTGPITVDQRLTVKARAFLTGYSPSAVARADFAFPFTGLQADISPTYDLTVVGPPYYQIYDGGNVTLFTGWAYGPCYTYFQYDLSTLPARPGWATGYRINSVQFTGVAVGTDNYTASYNNYQDGLYLVPDNNWDNNSINGWDYKPATTDLLCTWDYPFPFTGMAWVSGSGPELKSLIQAKADSTADKIISFSMLAMNSPSFPAVHYYYDKEAYGGGYRLLLRVNYDFVGTPSAADLASVLAAMDSKPADGNWNAAADIDGDGEITSADLSIVLANMQ